MALTIWKYPVAVTDEQKISMPKGAEILYVAVQGDDVCLWVQVNPDAIGQDRTIRIFGTGHPMPDKPGMYIGTFMLAGGALVFHAYESMP